MTLGITAGGLGIDGGNPRNRWGFPSDPLHRVRRRRKITTSPRTHQRRDVGKPVGAQASEGGTRPRQRRGSGGNDTIRLAPSGAGGSAETPLVQRSVRQPGPHEGNGGRTAEGPHHGELSGCQVPAAERVAEAGGAPGVRGQTVRTGNLADGWGERSGASVPPGAEAGSGRSQRETIPERSVRGHLRTRVASEWVRHRRVAGPGGQGRFGAPRS